MIINEIFYSLQGEGMLTGVPSVFVRLAGCPLRCRWCDTKFTWSESAGEFHTPKEVQKKIQAYPARHVVVTGGEPMMQAGLDEFIVGLAGDKHITIETAGIKYAANLRCDLMSISPKLSNSTPAEVNLAREHEQQRLDVKTLRLLIANYDYQLKFVIESESDIDEAQACVEALEGVDRGRVFLMPQARRREELVEKSAMLAEYCEKTGFVLGQRLHILLWDGARGR
jgi:7-carboxy-7-deazaguanine synthase